MADVGQNWARNLTYGAAELVAPRSVEELQDIVRAAPTVRALGTRHSFNTIADTPGTLISTEHLDRIHEISSDRRTVRVGAGIKYGQLGTVLDGAGFALPNLASLPHISVAGACVTATHGSGVRNGNLATAVSALDIVTADGSLRSFSRDADPELFEGAVVNLGALGVVSSLTLDLLPTFRVRQDVYEKIPVSEVLEHFDDIMGSAYSVSLFTEWNSDFVDLGWLKSVVVDDGQEPANSKFFGGERVQITRNPVPYASPANCTPQLGVPGPWQDRLPHFRFEFQPSMGEELQAEYFVPRENAAEAFSEMNDMREAIAPHVYLTEIRSIAADQFWLSPQYERECIAIHFTWRKEWDAVIGLLPEIERRLERFGARPHWGKLFKMAPDRVQSLYPKLPEFRSLMQELDPEGKFSNAFVQTYLK